MNDDNIDRREFLAKTAGTAAGAIGLSPLASSIAFGKAIPEQHLDKIEKAIPEKPCVKPAKTRKVLVFNLCKGFAHDSIPYVAKALEIMGKKSGAYETVMSSDMAVFMPENINQFDAVCFNNTTRLGFEDQSLRKSLMDFVKGGKGVIGIHAATDNFYKWPEAAEMMGGLFDGHPWGANDKVWVKVDDPQHPVCKAFNGKTFSVVDEIYQLKTPYTREKLRVLLSIDTTKTNMKKKGLKRKDNDFAISWVRSWGKGRVFYCSLGHNIQILWNSLILQHYLDGIQFAAGDLPADTTPSTAVSDQADKPL